MAAAVAVAVTWAFSLGCEKAPPEPGPLGALPPAAVAPSAAKRPASCLQSLPAQPPPPPPYAVDPKCPVDPAGGPPMVPIGHVVFPESKDAPTLEVELMVNEKTQERGLMYRRSMADDKGMLFVWRTPAVHTFWMHNTCIPLDMLFIDESGLIAGIVENVPTMNDDPRTIGCPVRYVLEVNAGWSRRHGVAPGQAVRIQGADL